MFDDVIKPYVENARSELDLLAQKVLLIWDAFKAQSMDTVKQRMSTIGFEHVQVRKNTSTASTCPHHKWIGEDRWKKNLSVGITLHAFQKL